MPRYWMVTDRNVGKNGLGGDRADLSFWTSEGGSPGKIKSWSRTTAGQFKATLVQVAEAFPPLADPGVHYDQKHVTLFVHGYNNDWVDAAARYESICANLFSGPKSLGICILFSWPSDGMKVAYLPDREDARECASDLAWILSEFYDWLVEKQKAAAADPDKACRAKVSMIAHSMGNYLLQKAMQRAWTRKNQPLLASLINQLLMVAADVDNDLFKTGEATEKTDGDAIANLTYRVTALYTGRDAVLGMSAGLKHFGKRRLGRSGLDRTYPLPDNVWDFDCTDLFKPGREDIHSAYFEEPQTLELMREVLRGVDRKVLQSENQFRKPQGR